MTRLRVGTLVNLCFIVVACTSPQAPPIDATATRPHVCEEIAYACKAFEHGSGKANECHRGGDSAWSEAECNANAIECFAACTKAMDSGAAADGQ